MSRKIINTALALCLAGGVYFAGNTAEASNMGFKLERSFAFVDGAQNLYFVSFPLFNGLGDVSDGTNCVSDGGVADGMVNADDILCELWTSRGNSNGGAAMTIQKLDTATCLFQGRTHLKLNATDYFFTGSFSSDITIGENREVGYLINVGIGGGDDPAMFDNRAVIVGSHDPGATARTIDATTCGRDVLNLPYHTMYRTANEILCGLEGMDWTIDPMTGDPDACGGGLYDEVNGKPITSQTFVNEAGTGGFRGRTVFDLGGGTLLFLGPNFDLTPGDAYLMAMDLPYSGRAWAPPHF